MMRFIRLSNGRIKALEDFELYDGHTITAGTLGGHIASARSLAQTGNSWVFPGAVIADNAYVSGNAVIEPSFSNPSLMSENIALVGASMNQQALAALTGTLTERDKGASYFNHQNAALYTWDGIKFVQTRLTLRDAGRTYFNPENNVIHRWNGKALLCKQTNLLL